MSSDAKSASAKSEVSEPSSVTGLQFNTARVTTALNRHGMNKATHAILEEVKSRCGENSKALDVVLGSWQEVPDAVRRDAEEFISMHQKSLADKCLAIKEALAKKREELAAATSQLEALPAGTPKKDRDMLVSKKSQLEARVAELTKTEAARDERLEEFVSLNEFCKAKVAAEVYQFRFKKDTHLALTFICEELIHDLCLHTIRNALAQGRSTFTDELLIHGVENTKYYTMFRNFPSWVEFCKQHSDRLREAKEREHWSKERRDAYAAAKKAVSDENKKNLEEIKRRNEEIDAENAVIKRENKPLIPLLKRSDVSDPEELKRRNDEIKKRNKEIRDTWLPLVLRERLDDTPKPLWEDLFKGYIKPIARLHIAKKEPSAGKKKDDHVCRISEQFTQIVSHLVYDLIMRFANMMTIMLLDVKGQQKTVDLCHVLGTLRIALLDADPQVYLDVERRVHDMCARNSRYLALKAKPEEELTKEERVEKLKLKAASQLEYEQPQKPPE